MSNDTYIRPEGTDLSNWRTTPFSRWAFQNVRALIPSDNIATKKSRPLAEDIQSLPQSLSLENGASVDLQKLLVTSETDSLLILHQGKVVSRWQAPHTDVSRPHIVFSISKSITAMLAGILVEQNIINVDKPVLHYLPGTRGSAYADAALRNLLDMNVALGFTEEYLNPDGDYFRYRNATCWNPVDQTASPETLELFLYSLGKADYEHGQVFNYKSPNTDLLGLVLERAAGISYADLLSTLIWQPMGATGEAYVTVDRGLLARGAGGICVTLEDLARFGELLLNHGAVGDVQIIPEFWIADTRMAGNESAWQRGDFTTLLPTGCYRNLCYQLRDKDNCFMGLGIHGQWLFINPTTNVVIAKLSSQTLPVDESLDLRVLQTLQALTRAWA